MPRIDSQGRPAVPGWYRVRYRGGPPQTVEVFRSGHDADTGEDKLWVSLSGNERNLLRVFSPQFEWMSFEQEAEYEATRAPTPDDDSAYLSLVSRVEDCLELLARNGLPGDTRDAHEVALLAELLHARLIRANGARAAEAQVDVLASESED